MSDTNLSNNKDEESSLVLQNGEDVTNEQDEQADFEEVFDKYMKEECAYFKSHSDNEVDPGEDDKKNQTDENQLTQKDTWDYSLKVTHKNSACRSIWITEKEFAQKLQGYNVFTNCEHDIIKIECPCPMNCKFSVCHKCHITFCSNKCIKYAKEKAIAKLRNPDDDSKLDSSQKFSPQATGDGKNQKGSKFDECNVIDLTEDSEKPNMPSSSNVKQKQHMEEKKDFKNKSNDHSSKTNFSNRKQFQKNKVTMDTPDFKSTKNSEHFGGQSQILQENHSNQDGPGLLGYPPRPPNFLQYPNFGNGSYMVGGMQVPLIAVGTPGYPGMRPYQQFGGYMPRLPRFPPPLSANNFTIRGQMQVPVQVMRQMAPPTVQSEANKMDSQHHSNINMHAKRDTMSPGNTTEEATYQQKPKEEPTKILRDPRRAELKGARAGPMQEYNTDKTVSTPDHLKGNLNSFQNQRPSPFSTRPTAPTTLGLQNGPVGVTDSDRTRKSSERDSYVNSGSANNNISSASSTADRAGPSNFNVNPFKHPKDNRGDSRDNQRWNPRTPGNYSQKSTSNSPKESSIVRPEASSSDESWRTPVPDCYPEGFTPPRRSVEKYNNNPPPSVALASPDANNSKTGSSIRDEPFILYGVPMMVGYSYGDSLFDFYAWNGFGETNNFKILNEVGRLQHFPPLKKLMNGIYCLAKYTEPGKNEGSWFRARIKNVHGKDKALVYFMDYGNEEIIDRSEMSEMPSSFFQYTPSAIRISIGGFEKFPTADPEALENYFTKYIFNNWIRATVLEKVESSTDEPVLHKAKLEVKYEDDWISLGDILEHEELGNTVPCMIAFPSKNNYVSERLPTFASANTEIQVMICDTKTKNFNDFLVIPVSKLGKREMISADLSAIARKLVDYSPSHWFEFGYICAAQRNDGQWARAKVCELTQIADVEIIFIDYGDTACVNLPKLKVLPENYLKIPQLTYRCSLPVFPISGTWDQSEIDMMENIAKSNDELFAIVFAQESENSIHIVEIFLKQQLRGLAKSLLKNKKDTVNGVYEVDYDIRKKIKAEQASTASHTEVTKEHQNVLSNSQTQANYVVKDHIVSRNVSKGFGRGSFPTENSNINIQRTSPNAQQDNANASTRKQFINESLTQNLMNCLGIGLPVSEPEPPQNRDPPLLETSKQNVSGRDDEHPKDVKVKYPFTVDFLKPPVSLHNFEKTSVFKITCFFSFNRAFMIAKSLNSTEFMLLQDELTDCVDLEPLNEMPPIGAVTVVPYNDGNFYRAIIKEIINPKTAKVQLVDLGHFLEMDLENLKPASDSVMEYPRLGYEVKLNNVDDSPNLLLQSDFDIFAEKVKRHRYIIDSCVGDGENEPYAVSLITEDSGRNSKITSISDSILQKQVWQWEKLYEKGFKNDNDLISNGSWDIPASVEDIIPLILPLDKDLEGQITNVTSEGCLWIININDSSIVRDQRVLNNQIERYVEKVAPSSFFPIITEGILAYPKDVPRLRELNLRGIGRWNRCYRECCNFYRNLDLGEAYAVDSDDIEIRKLCPEFLRVPLDLAECSIPNFEPSDKLLRHIQSLMKSEPLLIKFRVNSFDKDNYSHVISSPDFDELVKIWEEDMIDLMSLE